MPHIPFWGWQKQADHSYALGSTKGQTVQASVINLCMSAFLLYLLWCLSPEWTFRCFTVATVKALRWVDYSQNYKMFILSGIVFVWGLCFLLLWFFGFGFSASLFVLCFCLFFFFVLANQESDPVPMKFKCILLMTSMAGKEGRRTPTFPSICYRSNPAEVREPRHRSFCNTYPRDFLLLVTRGKRYLRRWHFSIDGSWMDSHLAHCDTSFQTNGNGQEHLQGKITNIFPPLYQW